MRQCVTLTGMVLAYAVLTIGLLGLLVGCTKEEPPPPVPPPPEDLSTWTVPELVQPPKPEALPPPTGDAKPTAAEKVYAYAPGTPYQVQVPVGWPLDVLLEPGEQVRNIVGGDRPAQAAVTPQEGTETLGRAIASAQNPQPQ